MAVCGGSEASVEPLGTMRIRWRRPGGETFEDATDNRGMCGCGGPTERLRFMIVGAEVEFDEFECLVSGEPGVETAEGFMRGTGLPVNEAKHFFKDAGGRILPFVPTADRAFIGAQELRGLLYGETCRFTEDTEDAHAAIEPRRLSII